METRLRYGILGIEEAHELATLLSRGSTDGHMLVVECADVTSEAQNALLKILETPAVGASLNLYHPNPGALLPTLRSRAGTEYFEISKYPNIQASKFPSIQVSKYLGASAASRLKLLGPLMAKTDSPEEKQEQRTAARIFLAALEQAAYDDRAWPLLAEIESAGRRLEKRDLPVRVIMEHLILSV